MSTSSLATSPSAIGQAVADYVTAMLAHPEAFRGQQLRGGGPVAEFEMLLSERTGFPYCIATSSGTNALLVAALALDLCGKKIMVEAGAWEGSLGALKAACADLIEVDSLMAASLDGVFAVLATDRSGERHAAQNLRLRCDQARVSYIEDTGWLPGITAPANERSLADVQVVSFGPGKPLCLGEGGALLCNSQAVYRRAVALSQHPERVMSEGFERVENPPLNARIHAVSALIGTLLLSVRPAPAVL